MQLKITLQSDLCAGAGKHYSSIIDLDTNIDEYGLPYIPAKRLKGCLKEAAGLFVDDEDIKAIFGVKGNNFGGSLSITDAKLENYEELVKDITENGIAHNEVTDLFCSVRSATSIDEQTHTVKDKTLRFVRVVNQYSPINNEQLCFVANVFVDKKYKQIIKNVALALRNIGYHRNRGLGAVKCVINDTNVNNDISVDKNFDDNKTYILSYAVRTDGDIMLPNTSSDYTMDFIPGTSVLGAFAGLYCRYNGDMGRFNKFFYSNDVKFSNLYITNENRDTCYPAMRFMAKRKAENGIFNTLNSPDGAPDKPMKKGYLAPDSSEFKVKTKRVYHNAVNSDDASLYMQNCICSGQYFQGTITAIGSKMNVLYKLLKKNEFRFGRSKTAQYSNCTIVPDSVKAVEIKNETITLKNGSLAAFVLRSDVIIVDKNGIEQTSVETLKSALNLTAELHDKSSVALTTISGYNAKWNLKKPHNKAFKAGSALIFKVLDDMTTEKYLYIGEKQNEGFGVVELIENVDRISDYIKSVSNDVPTENKANGSVSKAISDKMQVEKIKEIALENINDVKLNASQIGRLMLMCKEAEGICREDGTSCSEAEKMQNLKKRIDSIKTDRTRKSATEIYDNAVENKGIDESHKIYYIKTLLTLAKYQKKITAKEDE